MRGDSGRGLRQLRASLEEFVAMSAAWSSGTYLNELAVGFARVGQVAEGLAATEQAMERAGLTGARWQFPESLRIRGELLLMQADTGAAAIAEVHFRQALGWARQQGALSWELRAATSLARLLRDQGRLADVRALLEPVFDRFTEGFETPDLKAAKALLDALE
jgi:predicted ATPase